MAEIHSEQETKQFKIVAVAIVIPVVILILSVTVYNVYYLYAYHPVVQHTCSDTTEWVHNP